MNRRTKATAYGGMMSALALAFLIAASVLPWAKLALTALAGVAGAVTVMKCGMRAGVLSWIAVSVLALLLLPSKNCAVLYAVFFGPYSLLKNGIERIGKKKPEWVLKLIFCAAVSVLLFFFASDVLNLFPSAAGKSLLLFVPAALIVFVLYDIVFSKLIYLFAVRFSHL